jgi:hypothetical protein
MANGESISGKLPVELSLSQTSKNVMLFFLSFFFYIIGEQEGGTGLAWVGGGGLVPVEGGEMSGKRGRMVSIVQNFVHMYVNAKMIPIETVPGIGERRDKGEWWRG